MMTSMWVCFWLGVRIGVWANATEDGRRGLRGG